MTKICFIGNSHLGCIKRAWDQMRPEYPGTKIDFFIDRSAGTVPLSIGASADDAEVFTDILIEEGKKSLLVPADYKSTYIFSFEFSVIRLTSLYGGYRADEQAQVGKQQLISEGMYLVSATAALKATRAAEVARALVKQGANNVCIVEQPRPNEYLTSTQEETMVSFRSALDDGESIDRMYRQASQAAAASLGVRLLRQPEATVAGPLLSKGQFGLSDINDQSEGSWYQRGDFIHMNPDFGRLVMAEILAPYAKAENRVAESVKG